MKREKTSKRRTEKEKKSTFANCIITLCVLFGACVTLGTLWEYHRLGVPMPSDVVIAITGLWGGELLIVALRQIFGSDVTKKEKDHDDY